MTVSAMLGQRILCVLKEVLEQVKKRMNKK
jgi:hypothetical protein